ncbi:F0F1 ATP synthase subunit gamma [Buchnera aphidicola (Mollitrichosiphum nigrofasciatum)]|uniref:F0F1 ATP synthase subunit gamma n=1 Tax=Buchnera aphidicola TaxID=9 RepID=UPI0031B86252
MNTNLFKKVINKINSFEKKKIKFKLVLFGTKSFLFFKNFNYKIIKYIKNKGDKLKFNNILKIIKNLIQMYKKSKIDHIYVANNYFKNKLSQIPRIKKILPLLQSTTKIKRKINYIYEPKSISLFNFIFKKFIFTEIYQSFLENLSCEQAARMLAMKNATDNSNNMVENLRIIFNKARQFNVTQELNEIVSGASAIL